MKLRVSSFNILNTACIYDQRKELLKETVENIDADLLGLQEINMDASPALLSNSSNILYPSLLPQPTLMVENRNFRIDGNACLIKNSACVVTNSEQLVFSSGLRVAQKLSIRLSTLDLEFVNTHLDHFLEETRIE